MQAGFSSGAADGLHLLRSGGGMGTGRVAPVDRSLSRLILWGLRIAVSAKDRFGAILSFGVVAMLFWHVFINLGMVVGMMPVVGIPLPLLSYGGSFMVSTLIGVGLLLNVSMRRYLF